MNMKDLDDSRGIYRCKRCLQPFVSHKGWFNHVQNNCPKAKGDFSGDQRLDTNSVKKPSEQEQQELPIVLANLVGMKETVPASVQLPSKILEIGDCEELVVEIDNDEGDSMTEKVEKVEKVIEKEPKDLKVKVVKYPEKKEIKLEVEVQKKEEEIKKAEIKVEGKEGKEDEVAILRQELLELKKAHGELLGKVNEDDDDRKKKEKAVKRGLVQMFGDWKTKK